MELKNRTIRPTAAALVITAVIPVLLKAAGPATAPTTAQTIAPPAVMAAGPTSAPATAPALAAAPTTGPIAGPTTAPVETAERERPDRNERGRNGREARGSDPYSVLQVRSIFVKGNQDISEDSRPRRAPTGPYNLSAPNTLVFNGVTIVDDEPEAFIEDLVTNVVGTVRIGDAVAGGKVQSINFDDLSYIVHGQVRHISLGQDFNGNEAFAAAPTPPPTTATPQAPGQVVGAGASIPDATSGGSSSGLSSQDILARMKAKRAQEQQQMGIK